MKLILAVMLVLNCGIAQALDVRRDRFDFSVDLPPGYEDVSSLPAMKEEIVALGIWNASHDGLVGLFSISGFSGALSREDISKFVPKQPNVSPEKLIWKGLEIDAFRVAEEARGEKWITINVLVPTVPRAIQVRVFGPAGDEQKMRVTLTQALATLDAKTNWLNTGDRWKKGVTGLAGMIAFAVLLVWFARSRMQKKA